MAAETAFLFPCDGCGNTVDAREERPEDHDEDCPVRRHKLRTGQWEEPDDD